MCLVSLCEMSPVYVVRFFCLRMSTLPTEMPFYVFQRSPFIGNSMLTFRVKRSGLFFLPFHPLLCVFHPLLCVCHPLPCVHQTSIKEQKE